MQKRVSIDQALEVSGLKKIYIAEKLGISAGYVNAYLKNAKAISVENACIICELTGRRLNELDFGIKTDFF